MRPLVPLLACASFVLALPSRGQSVVFSDGFESGLTNWTATGLWNLQDDTSPCGALVASFPEGQRCAYYGDPATCTYETGAVANAGTLTLATPVLLPSTGPAATLRCWTNHITEGCGPVLGSFDRFEIDVSANGGADWTLVGRRCALKISPDFGVWHGRSIDLTPYLGQSILVRFRFDTVDEKANFHLGAFVDQVEIRQEVGTVFCADQTVHCPCSGPFNRPLIGYGNMSGCDNSAGTSGELAGHGTPSVANDTVVLNATELKPSTIAVLLQGEGTPSSGAPFADGYLCLTGRTNRIGLRVVSSGATSFPGPGEPLLSVRGHVPPAGVTRHYQVVYRDGANYCTAKQVNLTNGYTVGWTP